MNYIVIKYYIYNDFPSRLLGAVMHKLVLIIYAVMRDRKTFVLRKPEEHAAMLKAKNSAA